MKTTEAEAYCRRADLQSGSARWRRWTALFVLVLAASTAAIAGGNEQKENYAIIYGTVWGPDNRPVMGIPVKIQRQGDKRPRWERTSDRRGEFAVRVPVDAADYVLFAEVKTGKTKKRAEAKVHVEGDAQQVVQFDVALHLGN